MDELVDEDHFMDVCNIYVLVSGPCPPPLSLTRSEAHLTNECIAKHVIVLYIKLSMIVLLSSIVSISCLNDKKRHLDINLIVMRTP